MADPSNKVRAIAHYHCDAINTKTTQSMLSQDIELKKKKGESCESLRKRFVKAAHDLEKVRGGCTNKSFSGKIEIKGCTSKIKPATRVTKQQERSWIGKLWHMYVMQMADTGPFELP